MRDLIDDDIFFFIIKLNPNFSVYSTLHASNLNIKWLPVQKVQIIRPDSNILNLIRIGMGNPNLKLMLPVKLLIN